MRVAVISDTHMPRGGRALPQRCVELLRASDAILHAGDFMTVATFEQLRALGPPLHAVHGNVDEPALRAMLPERLTVDLGGVAVGMVHIPGARARRVDTLRALFPHAAAVVFGHTHMPEHAERDGFQIFNPGSPTERRRSPRHTMGLATIESGSIRFELVNLT